MNVVFCIRMQVVIAMMRSPPERSFLVCEGSKKGQHKLKTPAGLKRSMSEVAMITAAYGKYSQAIKEQAGADRNPASACPKYKQTTQVEKNELDNRNVVPLSSSWTARLEAS